MKKSTLLMCAFFAVSLFVVLVLYRDGKLIFAVDSNYPLFPIERIKDWIFAWNNSSSNLGVNNAFPRVTIFPYLCFLSIFQLLNLPPVCGQASLIFLYFFLSGVGVFKLASILFKKRPLLAFTAALIYMFNPVNEFLFEAWIPEAMFGWIAFPWVVYTFIKGLISKNDSIKRAIFFNFSFLLFMPTFANPPLLGVVFITLLLFFFYFLQKNRHQLGSMIKFLAVSGVIFVCLNMWLFLPIAGISREYASAISSSRDFTNALKSNSQYSSLINVIRLIPSSGWHNIFWGDELAFPITGFYKLNPVGILLSFLYPCLIVFPFLLKKKRLRNFSLFLFCIIGSCIFTILSQGAHKPFGPIYTWLFTHIPGFSMYRSPTQKFTWGLALFYSLLIGYSLYYIHVKCRKKTNLSKYLYPLLVCLLLAYQWPWFTGDIVSRGKGGMSSFFVSIPSYYYNARAWSINQKEDFRYLSLPAMGRGYLWGQYDWNYIGVDFTGEMLGKNVVDIGINGGNISQPIRDMVYPLLGEFENIPSFGNHELSKDISAVRLLDLLNIKYLILHNDRVWNHLHYRSTPAQMIASTLNQAEDIVYERSFGKLDMYRLNSPHSLGHIYQASLPIAINGELSSFLEILSLGSDTSVVPFLFLGQSNKSGQIYLQEENTIKKMISVNKDPLDFILDLLKTEKKLNDI